MYIISRRTEDPRNSNGNGKRERREREMSECGTRQQNLRTSRVERSRASDEQPTTENPAKTDEQRTKIVLKWTDRTR
jgi:hypothetical protein